MTNPSSEYDKGFDMGLTRRIIAYLGPYKTLAASGVLLALLTAALQPLPTLLQRYAIDHYLVPYTNGSNLDAAALYQGLTMVVLGYVGLRVLEFALTYLSTITVGYLGQNVLRDIRADVFGKLQRLHLRYFDQNPVGRLITRVTSDVDAINQFITGGLISLLTSTFLIIVFMTVMLTVNWRLALIAFTVLPFLFFATNFFRGKLREAFRETRTQQAIVNSKLNENITGMLTVQLFGRERRSSLDFDHSNRALLGSLENSVKWFSLFMPTVAVLGQVAIALVLYFAARQLLGVDVVGTGAAAAISVGTLFAFVQWTQQLFQPIQDLADVFNNLQAATASSERIFGVLDTEEEITDKPGAKPLENFRGQVDFDRVWFAYSEDVTAQTPDADDRWILRDFDLHIRPGESVALVGATGAGKTSVTALVSRFYDVQRGAVKVDGIDVRDLAQHDLRRHVGVVLQDVFLFAGTIESNLTLNNPDIPHERVVEACQYVGVHDYILSLEQGYQTEVRERGATLSTGQKQLLAFARALIQNPDILLVLDEATANVDTETELRIQDALKKVMQGRTSIIIAHRLSTIEHCDRIIVMRRGRIVEQGSHAELLAQGGYYAKLNQLQYAGAAD
ncbi:ABC transporter ATP-binding protein [Deinococcus wulumuqiensis]|uniref:ABC transporter ATP-binding protein n=1 Tax=Deinococcus wulumuqiensis TaxID=980427 RepID=A0AAV4K2P3_9DEIO|nr:ABC transporter ATP-binding protein [Deinococcus wulumuqiensis]QII19486.1 ABC transporter ATP-binding protein [Deinococcus wulumuqiensis R12]GGI76253.1 ABC transporter ATP-binding protein [Deinococcus wulumuqiensis]GGP29212.1 ABC transporter ATP-binding protein [Deinococcus wulumuqiensis]